MNPAAFTAHGTKFSETTIATNNDYNDDTPPTILTIAILTLRNPYTTLGKILTKITKMQNTKCHTQNA